MAISSTAPLLSVIALTIAGTLVAHAQSTNTAATPAEAPAPAIASTPVNPAVPLLKDAYDLVRQGDLDGALVKIDAAAQIDPKNVNVYLLRGSVYGQKKLWPRAQRDYETAQSLDPNKAIIKFNLAELYFMQKLFDNARPGFLALQKDPEVGDLASYKVFLCDIMTGHDKAAAAELAAFNETGGNPSYYYANAAWALSHNNVSEARGWLASATKIYSANKNALYSFSLTDLAAIRAPVVSFVTLAGKKYDKVQALLEENDLRVLTSAGWIMIPFEQLPPALPSFPEDWQYKIAAKRAPDADPGIKISSLTTKAGQKYIDVIVFVENTGLRLRTDTGFVTVPFDQLPDDLSAFTPDLQKQINAKRRPDTDATMGVKVSGFTTKQGQKYENVEVLVEDDDIRVHAPSGWTSVPFAQLPNDLSVFPIELQNEINAKRAPASEAPTGISVPVLTTRQGQTYRQVSVFVENSGLRIRTDTGFVTVPFDQLPDDLSALPTDLQKQITAKRAPVVDVTDGIKLPLLTTKQGQTYNNVQVFVENSGLRVRTANGFVSVPFEQLPDDLSSYPQELQKQIASRRRPVLDVTSGIKVPVLTTNQGQTYNNVDVFVENSGLRVRTANGFINIPFEQLPADLSSLPSELRKQIASKRKPVSP